MMVMMMVMVLMVMDEGAVTMTVTVVMAMVTRVHVCAGVPVCRCPSARTTARTSSSSLAVL